MISPWKEAPLPTSALEPAEGLVRVPPFSEAGPAWALSMQLDLRLGLPP